MTLLTFEEQRSADLGFGRAFPESCFLGKVCYLWRQRNAYYAYQSCNEFPGSYQLDIEKLTALAPIERGSQWSIDERPAVVIASEYTAILLMGDPWQSRPLAPLRRIRTLPYQMADLAQTLVDLVSGEGKVLFADASVVRPAALPFRVHTGIAVNRRRRWCASLAEIDLRPYLSLVAKFNRLLQQ